MQNIILVSAGTIMLENSLRNVAFIQSGLIAFCIYD